MDQKVEVGNVPEVGDIKFTPDTAGGTANVDREGNPFQPVGLTKINQRTLYQDSESNKAPRGKRNKSAKAIL